MLENDDTSYRIEIDRSTEPNLTHRLDEWSDNRSHHRSGFCCRGCLLRGCFFCSRLLSRLLSYFFFCRWFLSGFFCCRLLSCFFRSWLLLSRRLLCYFLSSWFLSCFFRSWLLSYFLCCWLLCCWFLSRFFCCRLFLGCCHDQLLSMVGPNCLFGLDSTESNHQDISSDERLRLAVAENARDGETTSLHSRLLA